MKHAEAEIRSGEPSSVLHSETEKTTESIRRAAFAAAFAMTSILSQVGCVGMHAPHPETAQVAIMCDKCKTTWVTRAEPGARILRYTREKAMVCPDCHSAVQNWVLTGKLKHHCDHCRGNMTCESPSEK